MSGGFLRVRAGEDVLEHRLEGVQLRLLSEQLMKEVR